MEPIENNDIVLLVAFDRVSMCSGRIGADVRRVGCGCRCAQERQHSGAGADRKTGSCSATIGRVDIAPRWIDVHTHRSCGSDGNRSERDKHTGASVNGHHGNIVRGVACRI